MYLLYVAILQGILRMLPSHPMLLIKSLWASATFRFMLIRLDHLSQTPVENIPVSRWAMHHLVCALSMVMRKLGKRIVVHCKILDLGSLAVFLFFETYIQGKNALEVSALKVASFASPSFSDGQGLDFTSWQNGHAYSRHVVLSMYC